MPLIKRKIILEKKYPLKKQLKDVETQTDDVLVNDDHETKELFVLKKIEDADKKLNIISPIFKLAGKEFSIGVHPDYTDSGYIGVFLHNYSNGDQMTSIAVKETSGVERSWEMSKTTAGKAIGFPMFLSHENYRKLAKVNGDILRLEVVLTLHIKAKGDGWTR